MPDIFIQTVFLDDLSAFARTHNPVKTVHHGDTEGTEKSYEYLHLWLYPVPQIVELTFRVNKQYTVITLYSPCLSGVNCRF